MNHKRQIKTNYPGTDREARFTIYNDIPMQRFARACPVTGFKWLVTAEQMGQFCGDGYLDRLVWEAYDGTH